MENNDSSDTKSFKVNDFFESYIPASATTSVGSSDMIQLISIARKGITFSRALALGSRLSLSIYDLAPILHISSRSLHRYSHDKVLAADTSAVVLRLEQLLDDGLSTFDNTDDLSDWLKSPLPYLNGKTPLEYLDTPFGFDLVTQLLGRIRHGVFA